MAIGHATDSDLSTLLAPFTSVDRRLPDSARVDHSIERRTYDGELTIGGVASFLWGGGKFFFPFTPRSSALLRRLSTLLLSFLLHRSLVAVVNALCVYFYSTASAFAQAFVSHHLFGPPKKSWGIEMSIFTNVFRCAANYSHLSSITRLRRILEIGQILPTPKDGVVTPITFNVQRRNLKGFLREADSNETGKRELSGEWVINRRLWRKMQKEYGESGRKKGKGQPSRQKVIMYLHGGSSLFPVWITEIH
jgi:hypothetical protein